MEKPGLFQTKLLFFQTIESAKRAFATRAGLGKPAFLHALFLENAKQNNAKNHGQCFPINFKVTCKNLAHWRQKKMA